MKLTYEAVDMITKRGQNMNKGTNSVIIDGTCPYTFISRVIQEEKNILFLNNRKRQKSDSL